MTFWSLTRLFSRSSIPTQPLALIVRQGVVQALGLVTGVVLARLLTVGEFGLYAILTFQFIFQLSIGDLGLGASVIRQTDDPDVNQLRAVQGTRLLVDLLQLVLVWLVAPWLASQYGSTDVALAFRIVALAVCVQSLQVVPTVLMERSFNFGKLACIESVQAVAFSSLAILAAFSPTPVRGIALAWLVYALTGSLLALRFRSWPLGYLFDRQFLRERAAFSLRYQGVHLATVLRDSFTPLVLGLLLGTVAVGRVSWATTCALSVALGSLVLQRFFMPQLSQKREDPKVLARTLEDAIQITHALVVPISVIILCLAVPLTEIVFGSQWLAALPIFYALWCANGFIPFLAPLFGFLHAAGRPDITLRFTIGVSAVTWLLGVPLVDWMGVIGYPIAAFAGYALTVLLIRRVQTMVPFRWLAPIAPIWLSALFVGTGLLLLQEYHPVKTFLELLLYGGCGFGIWLLLYGSWRKIKSLRCGTQQAALVE